MGSVTGCTCRDAVLCPVCRSLATRARSAGHAPEPPPRSEALSSPQETRVPHDSPNSTSEPEGAFLGRLRRLALDHGWLAYHTHDSRKSEMGFPDLCLARAASATSQGRQGRLIFAELKSQQGKVTREQAVWLDVLRHTVPGIEVYLWRPSDFNNIVQILSRK